MSQVDRQAGMAAPTVDPVVDEVSGLPGRMRTGVGGLVRMALTQYTILWILVAFIAVLLLTNENFGSTANLQSVMRQSAFTGIAAAGMTLLIIARAFDLSVGSILSLSGIAAASSIATGGIGLAIAVGVGAGAVLGFVNGVVVTRLRIPALVATLGTLYVFQSLAFIWTDGQVKIISDPTALELGTGNVAGLPTPFVIMVGVYLLCAGLLRFTSYGRMVRAVGSNGQAALVAGIPVNLVLVLTFVLVGMCTGLAAVLLSSQLSSATASMGLGYELNVIAIVILGGTSLAGGHGTLFGTLCAALFFAILNNALNLYGVDPYWQYVAVGGVIISALAIDAARDRLMIHWLRQRERRTLEVSR